MEVVVELSKLEMLTSEAGMNMHFRVNPDGCLEIGHQVLCAQGLFSKVADKVKGWFGKTPVDSAPRIGYITLPQITCGGTHLYVELQSSIAKTLMKCMANSKKPGLAVQTDYGIEVRLEAFDVVANLNGAVDLKSLEFRGNEVRAKFSFDINPLIKK